MTKETVYLLEVAIEPKSEVARASLREALEQLTAVDLTFGTAIDSESGQTLLRGTSEAQLEEKVGLLRSLYDIQFAVGAPQVAYRETLSRPVSIKYTHKKQTGGSGQFAEVSIDFRPLPAGSGFVFENDVVGGSIPKEFVLAIEKGLKAQKEFGLLAGFPVIDFKATLTDGKYHEVDSNALTFDIAARRAFRELASVGAVKLLEPVMKVEVTTPGDFLGGVIGDLNSRRGEVESTEDGELQVITALVPLASLFGYNHSLRSLSQGRARCAMRFDHFADVPMPGSPDPKFPAAAALRVA
ncbi:MAG TPA: hypothetical protein VII56_09105 [Rhizomicrobium sp.]